MAKSAQLSLKSDAPGKRLFLLGNEAIARGAVEAGVQVAACYPGTPSTEIMEALVEVARDFDIYAEWSVNEKVALEVALAASICGVRAATMMKHVGVNVAHDPLMTAGYIGARGGLVLVSADDPGQWSSQTEQDNRYIAEQAYIPVLEPYNAQEAKDMMRDAFRLSEEFGQPFMLRSETRIGHARGDVVLGEIFKVKRQGTFEKNVQKLVAMPGNARRNRVLMVERMAKIKEAVDSFPYNQLKLKKGAKLGIIASGISYSYALEAVRWLKMGDKVSWLKIGTPYPLPEKLIRELLGSVPVVVVMEELEPIIETHVKAIAQEAGIAVKIHGKDVLPLIGELSIRKVAEALIKLTGAEPPVDFAAVDNLVKEVAPLLPVRPPTLCAGCPHRATLYAINKACDRIKNETGLEPIRPGDIGCYAMGASYPLDADDTAICMGSGFDTANGLARVIKNPIVGHLGDSTFFHSGIPPMLNAVYNQTRIAMVVMDNLVTAMTGFQPHPGTGRNANSDDVQPIKPEDIARASGVKYVEVIDPLDLSNAIDILEKAIKFPGPSLVVSRHPCNILELREKRGRGEKIVPYHVEQEKCVANSLPFCTAACPLHIDVRKYVGLIGESKYAEALNVILEKLPFPAIMGRICSRPCESECKRSEVDESIAIAALKRSAADHGMVKDPDLAIPQERKEKVAIVGGGPAGIMAAYDLRKMGYKVTIFEAASTLGGMLSSGIPEYRLPRDILHNEIDVVNKLGAEVRLNTRVGQDVTLSSLKKNNDAVFLAVGAQSAMKLNVAGEDLKGVYLGLDFLREVNNRQKPAVGQKVVVVGGGNVAVDAALSTLRLGVEDVTLVCLERKEEMPAYKEEIAQAEEEGVRLMPSWGIKRIIGAAGECDRYRAEGLYCGI